MMKSYRALIVLLFSLFAFEIAHAQGTKTDYQVARYQRLLLRNPRAANTYLRLGDALIRKARETGDPGYFNRAEQALKKSLELEPKNSGAERHLAYVYYSRHEFLPAAVHARRAVEINPQDGDSYGVLGDALLEVGQYLEAQSAYATMMELDESLYSYSRLAGLKSIRGDTAGAIADLERAIAIGKAEKQPAESIAWAEWQLGSDYFAVGELEKAETYFKRSVKTYPNYYRALAGLAQVCAAQNRLDQAIDLYEKAIAILPMPEYAAALGDVYLKIGEPRKAKQQYDLVEYIGKLSKLNQALYNRELAYFYADHDINLEKGLELAARELDYRKDVYAYDLLAWSLYKNGEVEGAREAIDIALKLGTKDAKIFYHAGMIYNRLGNERKALEFLKGALATNPHFHIFHAVKAEKVLKGLENLSARIGTERQGLGG